MNPSRVSQRYRASQQHWSLSAWEHKCSVINLVQDYLDPCTREITLDWLHAPPDKNGDYFELTQAIAVCHLDGNLKNLGLRPPSHCQTSSALFIATLMRWSPPGVLQGKLTAEVSRFSLGLCNGNNSALSTNGKQINEYTWRSRSFVYSFDMR